MKLRTVLFITSLAIGGYAWSTHRRAILPRVIHFDAYFSAMEQDAIVEDIAFRPYRLDNTAMCEKHPSIKGLTVQSRPNYEEIAIHSWRPVSRINDDSLLIENGVLVSAQAYNASFVQTLPIVGVPSTNDVCPKELLTAIQTADQATWSAGNMTWFRPSYIEFQLHAPELSIVLSSQQLKETTKLIDSVRNVFAMQPSDRFDVRFEKQIIAFDLKIKKESFDGAQDERGRILRKS